MTTIEYTKIKSSKKIALSDFMTSWQDFYGNYNNDDSKEKYQNFEAKIKEETISCQQPAKKSFRKVKRSKTLDINTFLDTMEDIYGKFDESSSTQDDHLNNKVKAKFYEDSNRGENSMDFSSLDTAITPLRDLKIEEHASFTPFRIKDSPKNMVKTNDPAKIAKIHDLKNTLRRNDINYEEKSLFCNKETRKYSVKKGVKKTTTSSRILKFD